PRTTQRTIAQDPGQIKAMFNDIAPTYDLLNRLLSFGMDSGWRRKAIAHLKRYQNGTFLDIASGSGDVALDLLSLHPRKVIASDFAFEMLKVLRTKTERTSSDDVIQIVSCDALSLPFRDCSFDGTIVAFGIRNFADRLRSLKEMYRVLKKEGTSVVLELT